MNIRSNNVAAIFMKAVFPFGVTKIQLRRMIKATIVALIAVALNFITKVSSKYGSAPYLMLIMAVTLHPGRSFGKMIESVVLVLGGASIGTGYGCLWIFCAQRIRAASNERSALAFLAIMEVIMLMYFGYVRSVSERLFPFVFLTFLVVHFSFSTSAWSPISDIAKSYTAPILTSTGVSLLVNLLVFPEFGSTALGVSCVGTLNEMHDCIYSLTVMFFGKPGESMLIPELQKKRQSVVSKLKSTNALLTETAYEISYAYLSPQELKSLLKRMDRAANTSNSLVGACEAAYALLGSSSKKSHKTTNSSSGSSSTVSRSSDEVAHVPSALLSANAHTPSPLSRLGSSRSIHNDREKAGLLSHRSSRVSIPELMAALKPHHEIERGDPHLLLTYLETVKDPVMNLMLAISDAYDQIKQAVASAYDVPAGKVKLAKKATPEDQEFSFVTAESLQTSREIIEAVLSNLVRCVAAFDESVPELLEKISSNVQMGKDNQWLLPRDEYFLLSLFMLNFREYASLTTQALVDAGDLLRKRQKQESKGIFGRKFWFSSISSKQDIFKFLSVGHSDVQDSDIRSFKSGNTHQDSQHDTQAAIAARQKTPLYRRILFEPLIKILDFAKAREEHLKFGFKVSFLLMLVSFPGYIPESRSWFVNIRGTWVAFVAILTIEPSLGGTIGMFIVRTVGLVLGSAWGYCSYEVGWANTGGGRVVMAIMMSIGYFYGYYYLIATPYTKAALIGIVSMDVVVQGTVVPAVPGTILQNFAKRCLAMLVGGTAAFLVQLIIFPVKAREELVKQLVESIKLCGVVETEIEAGSSSEVSDYTMAEAYTFQVQACSQARHSLALAEKYRGLTTKEPRLKGSFRGRTVIYREIIFVLGQIVDRFDNVAFLRKEYGSVLIDDLAPHVQLHKLQFYGCLSNIFQAVQQALDNKMPLPQFMPSARIAHARLVSRVRELILQDHVHSRPASTYRGEERMSGTREMNQLVKKNYMSWSATSVAFEQIVEYTEELIDLIKLLVGVSEFRYGFLSRPLNEASDAPLVPEARAIVPTFSKKKWQDMVSDFDKFDYDRPQPYSSTSIAQLPFSMQSVASRKRSNTATGDNY